MNAALRSIPPLAWKLAGIVLLGGLGAAVGFTAASVGIAEDMPWDDALALLMAVTLIAMGLLGAVNVATRPASVPKGCGVLQVAVFLMAGGLFLLPLYGPAWISSEGLFAGIVAVLALQTVANVLLWRRADEMLRRVMLETSALAFWALQSALFLYAAAERLGLVGGVTAWGMMAILMAVYLLASIVAALRRGLT